MNQTLLSAILSTCTLPASHVGMSVTHEGQSRIYKAPMRDAYGEYMTWTKFWNMPVNNPKKAEKTTHRRRKNLRKVSAKGRHNHAAFLKRERKRQLKKQGAREVRQFVRQTFRDYCAEVQTA